MLDRARAWVNVEMTLPREECTMNIPAQNHYLSVDQVAARFSVSKDTIWRWRRNGDFPAPRKLGGNTSRWRLSEIEEWEGQCRAGLVYALRYELDAAFLN